MNDVNKLEVEFLASIVSTRLYFKLHLFPFCFGFLFFVLWQYSECITVSTTGSNQQLDGKITSVFFHKVKCG